ncbi:MAG: multi-sensor hybrid histidine kinase, partial [Gemmatimonadetes bacterium]|nr:multi-sensor hybrid histidine kinase [Gemmatimonadota bacterium]
MTAPVSTVSAEAPRRILVVEDSATQAAALAVLLERAGYATSVARRADRALEILDAERIDLVLSDVVMPGMDGYELCRRIKAEPARKQLPVVLLTSLTDPLAVVRGLASGADHYVTKPYDADGLLARVRFVFAQAADPSGMATQPFEIELLGERFTIRATKEQILEMLVSSYSDLVRTSEVLRDAEQRARFLAEATELLSSTLDAKQVLADLAQLAVPRIADLCVADLLGADGIRRRVTVAHAIVGVDVEPSRETETATQSTFIDEVIASGSSRIVEIANGSALAELTTNTALGAALDQFGPHSLLAVPLVARGRVIGVLQFITAKAVRANRAEDILLIEDLARRAALAVDNALLYEEARRATRARDDVLAIVSHDLRNPINTIQMSTSFLLDVLTTPGAAAPPIIPQL